jgi:hypothetical protein
MVAVARPARAPHPEERPVLHGVSWLVEAFRAQLRRRGRAKR